MIKNYIRLKNKTQVKSILIIKDKKIQFYKMNTCLTTANSGKNPA